MPIQMITLNKNSTKIKGIWQDYIDTHHYPYYNKYLEFKVTHLYLKERKKKKTTLHSHFV